MAQSCPFFSRHRCPGEPILPGWSLTMIHEQASQTTVKKLSSLELNSALLLDRNGALRAGLSVPEQGSAVYSGFAYPESPIPIEGDNKICERHADSGFKILFAPWRTRGSTFRRWAFADHKRAARANPQIRVGIVGA